MLLGLYKEKICCKLGKNQLKRIRVNALVENQQKNYIYSCNGPFRDFKVLEYWLQWNTMLCQINICHTNEQFLCEPQSPNINVHFSVFSLMTHSILLLSFHFLNTIQWVYIYIYSILLAFSICRNSWMGWISFCGFRFDSGWLRAFWELWLTWRGNLCILFKRMQYLDILTLFIYLLCVPSCQVTNI